MTGFNPTPSQRDAINETGRALLVSAAAGSGKTRVLTERLLKQIESGRDIDEFLVITFTKAAAAELRSRILDEISERLAEDPLNARLRRQSALCSRAHIGTIDSWCQSFLREHCHAARVSPDFRVIEEDRAAAIRARVLERVLDKRYESPDSDFLALADTIGAGRDDKHLSDTVLSIHAATRSHARPDMWLRGQLAALERDYADAGETPWGAELLLTVRASAAFWADRLEKLLTEARRNEKIYEKYSPSIAEAAASLRDFARACSLDWDRALSLLPISFPTLGRLMKSPDPELSEHIKQVWKLCRASADKYPKLLSAGSEKLLGDIKGSLPIMRALIALTLDFDAAYTREKRRRAELDFADLEHLTAQLLTNPDGSPTELAGETGARFCEIMVDEYQDVNRVQDDIFRALSGNGERLFCVGDVKQSIYRFRLADPLIFTEKYDSYAFLADAAGEEPAKITLSENFRSGSGIIDCCNAVFGTLMSRALGDINYDENAALRCGSGKDSPRPELLLLDAKGDEDDLRDKSEREAAAVAGKILEMTAAGVCVDGRPLRFGDICILMRSANSVGEVYRRELTVRGIPVAAGAGGNFFRSTEIASLRSLLAVIDNPRQDVALIATLRSPAFGFSADELTEIRVADRDGDFYSALVKAAEGNEKCADFLKTLSELRLRAADSELGELLRHICDGLDIEALCSAMSDPALRCANLRLMLELARRFEANGFHGVHGFCNWLERLSERGDELGAPSGGDAVRIMTIHKSKGLEFPVVFLCDTGRRFNNADRRKTVLVHPRLGLGAKIYDTEHSLEYPGLIRSAISRASRREQLSEELRLLYVALTRAKDRLIVTGAVSDPENRLEKLRLVCAGGVSAEMLLERSNFAEWLVCAQCVSAPFDMSVLSEQAQERETAEPLPAAEPDEELVRRLEENAAYVYPHEAASRLPSKITATELKRLELPDEEAVSLAPAETFDFRVPKLESVRRLRPAERGTATHLLLQFVDYGKTGSLSELEEEKRRLTDAGFLSEQQAQAVELESVLRLFASPLGRRILGADDLRREFKFSLMCPAEEIFGEGEGERVLLQGVIDCVIEERGGLTVIDYKTDRVFGQALKERAAGYEKQLRAYAYAAERITGKPVRSCVLYFLRAGEAVEWRP